jgi:hypothetical protein
MLAQAFAEGTGFEFAVIDPGNIMSAYYGETAKKIKAIFDKAISTPTVIFIDELDAFGPDRRGGSESGQFMRQILTQLLQSMQELVNADDCQSVLIGCTNMACELDDAIRRRFTSLIYCDLPTPDERCDLIKISIPDVERDASLTDAFITEHTKKMELFSGSDITRFVNYVREAPQIQMQSATHFRRNNMQKWEPCEPTDHGAKKITLERMERDALAPRRRVNRADFERVLETFKPTLTADKYNMYLKELGEIGGGDLSQRVDQIQDTVKSYDPTTKEKEIDGIIFSKDLRCLTTDEIIQEANTSLAEPLSHAGSLQKFMYISTTDSTSECHKTSKQVSILVLILLWVLSFIPNFIWIVVSLVSLLVLTNVVIIPLQMWYKSMRSGGNADALHSQLENAKEYMFVFIISAMLCLFDFVHITNVFVIDAFVLTWIFYSVQATVVGIAGYAMFCSRCDVHDRRNYLKGLAESGFCFMKSEPSPLRPRTIVVGMARAAELQGEPGASETKGDDGS